MSSSLFTGAALEGAGVVNSLENCNAASYFGTPELRSAFLHEASFDDFTSLATVINQSACLRVNPILDSADTATRYVPSSRVTWPNGKQESWNRIRYFAPPRESTRPLLEETFAVGCQLENPEEAATLFGLGLVAIHPFRGGNGRTGRVMHGLLAHGYTGSAEDQALFRELGSHAGRQRADLDPEKADLSNRFMHASVGESSVRFSPWTQEGRTLSWLAKHAILRTASDFWLTEKFFGVALAYDGARERSRSIRDYCVSDTGDNGQEYWTLQIDKVFPNPGSVNTQELRRRQAALKIRYVKSIIDCFREGVENPLAAPDEIVAAYALGPQRRHQQLRTRSLQD